MLNKIYKIFTNFIFYITIFSLIARPVSAQEITAFPSETPALTVDIQTPTVTLTPDPTYQITATFSAEISSPSPSADTPTPTPLAVTPTLIPELDTINSLPSRQSESASIKQPVQLLPFARKNFGSDEKVQARIINIDDNNLQITLKHHNQAVKIPVNKSQSSDGMQLILTINPPRVFSPGKYLLEITDLAQIRLQQEFNWGILNIETDKSIYAPGDVAQFGITVTDEKGLPVCDAHLTLKIEFPQKNSTFPEFQTLTTADRSVTVNPACQKHQKSPDPDYLTWVKLNESGIYKLELNATTKSGKYSLDEQIEVRENLPFTLTRISPQRINSQDKYPVILRLTANHDFQGQVIEIVPQQLTVIPPETGQKYDFVKIVALDDNQASSSAVISLNNPFTGTFRQTLAFGQNVTDWYLKRQYAAFGNIGHDGVDFALAESTPVIAAANGRVSHTGWGPYGNTVIIRHAWGQTYYGHLSKFTVVPDQYVSIGEQIGLSGHTGLSTGPHLHFGLRLNKYDFENGYFGKVDPLLYLNANTIYSENSIKQISWNVQLKKGETVELGYLFNAPDISSKAYLVGPLKFIETGTQLADKPIEYAETRKWQLLADTLPVKVLDYAVGSVEDLFTDSVTKVTTNTQVIAVNYQLYLAAVSTSPNKTVDRLEGLGLLWNQVASQCSDKNNNNVALFWTRGAPSEDGIVTAHLNEGTGFKGSAMIAVYRIEGVDPVQALGAVIYANTYNLDKQEVICEGMAQESDRISFDTFSTMQDNSLVFVAVSFVQQEFLPSELYVNKQFKSGNRADSSGLAIQYQLTHQVGQNLSIEGSFKKPADWSLLAVEIIVDQKKPTNIMRHGKWFSGNGTLQPFNL